CARLAAVTTTFVGFAAGPVAAQRSATDAPLAPLKVIDTAYINHKANACVDFFDFANGAWLARDTIPAAYSSSGVGRDMSDRNQLVVRSVLDDAVAKRKSLPEQNTTRKLGTFYASCMDSSAIERAGVTPLSPTLAAIDAITGRPALVREIAKLQLAGDNVGFYYNADVDVHDAAHYLGNFDRGGLGLPDRDYYTKTDPSTDSLRKAYVDHIAKMLTLAGTNATSARADAAKVLALETELAKASLQKVARRDPAVTDHSMTMAKFRETTPNVDWTAYFQEAGLSAPLTKINVGEPAFFKRLNELVATTPIESWRAYLRYHALSSGAPWLSTPFVDENFAFSRRFTGAKALLPRWKRCLQATDGLIGEALGQAYVAKTFPPAARARAKAVIDDIRASFGERVKKLDWMSDATKKQALNKLTLMREKVGYPDTWRDYSKLESIDGPFVLNVMRANTFEWKRTVNRPGENVDLTEWGITVPTVNAYYNPAQNEMVFPSGALAPQTFDANADDAANYGSLGGSWAGHELTHGFDDQGRHYDAKGNLRDWWLPTDSVHFSREADKVAKQFDGFVQIDTFHVNGKLTLGENIADYGGLLTAYDALQRALQRNGRPKAIEGFSPEQRFFLGYAQSWRSNTRREAMKNRVTVDEHAPERWRTNGPLSNMSAFAAAFGCKPGDPMVRSAALIPHIW
ncbi:MAG TPA: M13 family metallopeptidase, partial [Gemmatimonadaceae bacterium]|nr:M13 family metallopeptidase [Gemmatimonadaceae bacterium]